MFGLCEILAKGVSVAAAAIIGDEEGDGDFRPTTVVDSTNFGEASLVSGNRGSISGGLESICFSRPFDSDATQTLLEPSSGFNDGTVGSMDGSAGAEAALFFIIVVLA